MHTINKIILVTYYDGKREWYSFTEQSMKTLELTKMRFSHITEIQIIEQGQ